MSEYELQPAKQQKRTGCLWFCLKAMVTVIVGYVCIQLVIAVLTATLLLNGDAIEKQFDEIQQTLEATPGAYLTTDLPHWV